MKKLTIILFVVTNLILVNVNLNAEWSNSFGISSYYDEKPFHYNSSTPLNFNNSNLNIIYNNESSGLGLNYLVSYSLVPQISFSQLTDNSINLSYNIPYGQERKNNILFSALYGLKYNTGDFTLYNNSQYGISAQMNQNFTETTLARAGYKGSYKNYYNNTDLSYMEHILYIGYKTYFETNTSLNTELDYGYKDLSNRLFSFAGKGSRNQSSQTLGQVIASIKIGQSLAEKTGLSLMYSQSWNTSTTYQSMLNFNPDFIFEKEIYDDTYSYESRELTLTLTQYLPYNIKIQGYGFYHNKNYEYSYDFSNNVSQDKRKDLYKGLGVNIEKNFDDDFLIFKNTKLTLNYLYSSNSSNSEFFNYKSNAVNFGIKF